MTLVLYGSSVPDASITTACDMGTSLGGSEIGKTTTISGTNDFAEITSQGIPFADVTAIPAIPTGNGWVYKPGAMIVATALWAFVATIALAGSFPTITFTPRVFRLPGGSLASAVLLGSWTPVAATSNSKVTYNFGTTSVTGATMAASDYYYWDLWLNDTGEASGDNPTIYGSNIVGGIANDFQVTTSLPALSSSLYAPLVVPGAVIGPSIWQGPPGLKYPSKMGPVIRRANGIFRGGGGLMGKNILRRKWWQVLR